MSQISQKGATGPLALTTGGSFQSSTDANLATLVGTRWDLSDGREVILVGTSSVTGTTAGQLYQDAALIAGHLNMAATTVTTYSANGNVPASVVVTVGTAITANQYQGGFAIVNAGAGIGQTLRIASNTANTASAATIVLEDAPNVALSTSTSKISLIPAHGKNIIVSPTTISGAIVGIGLYPIAASSYGFLLSKGITAALSDATAPAVGVTIGASTTTAGTIGSGTIGTVIGNTIVAATSAEAKAVFLNV